jgi:hypothetical protein
MAVYYLNTTVSDLVPVTGDSYNAVTSGVVTGTPSNFAVAGATTADIMAWSTDANVPNRADWSNGSYQFSVDVSNIVATLTARCRLYRVNSSGVIQETIGTGPDFTTTAIHTGSFAVDPSAGNASDRYQLRINADNSDTMMGASITVSVDGVDSFIVFPEVVVDTGSSNDAQSFFFQFT